MEREPKRTSRPIPRGDGRGTTPPESERGERASRSSPRIGGFKILVIDDSEIVLEATREMLKAGGFQVVTCDSPIGAGLLVVAEQPDLVLVDLNMASVGGERVVSSLKSGPRTGHIPVYLYTSAPASEVAAVLKRSRADGVIPKGGSGLDLATALRGVLGR